MNHCKFCIFMPTTIEISESCSLFKKKQLENNTNRMNQYKIGIDSIIEINGSDIPYILSDNSGYFLKDSPLKTQLLSNGINIVPDAPNNLGGKNKGAGIIEQWTHSKELIMNYDYIIHFEPRQYLQNNNFIENFIENPRSLFTFNKGGKHFNTGLFVIKTKQLLEYINVIMPHKLKSTSLEDSLYSFFKSERYSFDTIEKMGVIWHDSRAKRSILM
jgi:hypothetical protein